MIQKSLDAILSVLPKRQKEIISQRFGVLGSKPKTLATLGTKYGITRERVRQIEAVALKAIVKEAQKVKELCDAHKASVAYLKTLGGVRRADVLMRDLPHVLKDNTASPEYLELLFSVFKSPSLLSEKGDYYSLWYLDQESLKKNKDFVKKIAAALRSKKEDVLEEGRFNEIFSSLAKASGIGDVVGLNYLLGAKHFAVNPFGDFGLSLWTEIVPKTIRDKSYLVLKKHRAPLHFRDIATKIDATKFDHKKAHPQTVHNELIKDRRFVLVGRGLYSLVEFGIVPGTTRDILKHVLKKHGPLSLEKIVQLVGQQRVLKHNTIVLNLQNKKHFRKNEKGVYHLA